jgi:hypothetical protein
MTLWDTWNIRGWFCRIEIVSDIEELGICFRIDSREMKRDAAGKRSGLLMCCPETIRLSLPTRGAVD